MTVNKLRKKYNTNIENTNNGIISYADISEDHNIYQGRNESEINFGIDLLANRI